MSKKKINLTLVIALLLCFHTIQAQTRTVIDDLDNQYQGCLDSGANMLRCSQDYYLKMDSILNLTYSRMLTRLPHEKARIVSDQTNGLRLATGSLKKLTMNLMKMILAQSMFL